ncbi:MAG: hypothetical protein RLZZ303_1083 [Candidatus Hydrogenedentota bacterium]|jgi:hypothetical protein
MRVFAGFLMMAVCGLAAWGETVVEPSTEESFPAVLKAGDAELRCTGTSVRRVYGFNIYAIAHYGDPSAAPAEDVSVEEQLKHWEDSAAAKAMVIRFVFSADEGNMRQFAGNSLEEAGYTGERKEAFLEAFARDYASGDEARLVATGDALAVEINGEAKGTWQDRALATALWKCWLGDKSVLKDRAGLVSIPVGK